jgi:hypothetical protein
MMITPAVLVWTMFVIVSVMSDYVMTTILLQHRLTLAHYRKLFIFTHSSNREIQGLFFMWSVMV